MTTPTNPPTSDPLPPSHQTAVIIDDHAFRTGLKWGFFGYFGVYAFAILVGLLCAGAMLLLGSILAAIP